MFNTRVSIFVSLAGFALLGNLVTAEKAFVITAYYNSLFQIMTIFFPQGIATVAETLVSIKRIQMFMLYDEKSNVPFDEYMSASDTPMENVNVRSNIPVINGNAKQAVDTQLQVSEVKVSTCLQVLLKN